MIKGVKKVLLIVTVLSFTGGVLAGCGSDDKATVSNNKTTANENISEHKNDTKNQTNKESENKSIKDVHKLKEELNEELGEGEIIKNISINGEELLLKVDLGNQTNGLPIKDLAETRYSGLTDYLLNNGTYQVITVDFIGVGKVSMDINNAVEKDINGIKIKYFNGEDIRKNFK